MGSRAANRLSRVYNNLAILLEAGVPILRSLDSVREGTTHHMSRALRDIRELVTQGGTLAEAMQVHHRLFKEFDRRLINTAETSGRLGECLHMLSDWYDFRDRMQRRVLAGFLLPILMWHIAAAVIPIPRLALGEWDVIGYIQDVVWLLAFLYIPMGAMFAVYFFAPQRGVLRQMFDRCLMWIPVLRVGLRELGISRFCRSFGMLYKSGVPMVQALEDAVFTTGNTVVSAMVARCPQMARQGEMASMGFSRKVPLEYRDLWTIGEESGELDRTVDKAAELSADRADLYLSEFCRWLPRFVYAMIAIAMIFQILNLAGQVRGVITDFTF